MLYLNNLFNVSGIFFRATGWWENVSEIGSNLKDCKVDIYKGDKNKIFIKRFPEIHVDIYDIEGRYLYFFDENNRVDLHQILKVNIYSDYNLFEYVKNEITCLVQNMREYEGTSLTIIINKEYSDEVIRVLNKTKLHMVE